MMGNRGILHDDKRRIVKAWQVKRWIACVLEFRGRYRSVMTPHRYTELFFLDEAAAFAAGHRPCRECRYADYQRFRNLWAACHHDTPTADLMDATLHRERLDGKKKRTYAADVARLPNGTYIVVECRPWLIWEHALYAWADSGYTSERQRPARGEVEVLTPPSIVRIFEAGYVPGVHSSCN